MKMLEMVRRAIVRICEDVLSAGVGDWNFDCMVIFVARSRAGAVPTGLVSACELPSADALG